MDAISGHAFAAPRNAGADRPFVDLDHLTPDSRLTRRHAAEALTQAGYPTTPGQLAGYAHRGDGPPYIKWGRSVIYIWGSTLRWAQERTREVPA